VCISVAILAIVVVAITSSMITASSTSDLTARRSQAESYARRVAEVVRSDVAITAVACNGASAEDRRLAYENAINQILTDPAPSGFTYNVTKVVSTDAAPAIGATSNPKSGWSETCSTPQSLARVTVTAKSIDAPNVETSVSVLQRSAGAP
jgi:hypothetical protein